jgi:hypothetical protein
MVHWTFVGISRTTSHGVATAKLPPSLAAALDGCDVRRGADGLSDGLEQRVARDGGLGGAAPPPALSQRVWAAAG